MTTHELKCWPEFFKAIMDGTKRFEVRKNDRNYQLGDRLYLREWDPATQKYSGWSGMFMVTYLTERPEYALPGTVIMSIFREDNNPYRPERKVGMP